MANRKKKREIPSLEDIAELLKEGRRIDEEQRKSDERYYEKLFSEPYEISMSMPKNLYDFIKKMAEKENIAPEEWILKEIERKYKQDTEKKEWKDLLNKLQKLSDEELIKYLKPNKTLNKL